MSDQGPNVDGRKLRERLVEALDQRCSHPSTLPRRARLYMILAAAPAATLILGFLLLVAWSFLEPQAGIAMLLRVGLVLRFLVPLLGFLAGAAATGLLILLASKARIAFRGFADEGGVAVAWMAAASLVVGLVGLGILNSGDGRLEILGHVLMVLPFVATISALVVIAERRRHGAAWWVWLGLPLVVFVLLYLSVMTGSGVRWVADALEDAVGPALEQLRIDGLLGDLEDTIRAVTAILLFCGLGLWAVLWSPWRPDEEEEASESRGGLLSSIWRVLVAPFVWLRKLLGVDDESDDPGPPDKDAWVAELLATNDARPWRWEAGEPWEDDDLDRFMDVRDGIPPLGSHEVWGSLFLDAPISRDQAEAIETFVGAKEDALDGALRPGVLPDLLLEAEDGGGGLETLAAAVVSVALIRGQGSLVLVPDDAVLRQVKAMVEEILGHVQVDGLIACGSLVDRKGISAEGSDVPQVMLGKVEDVEACFFDPAFDDGARRTLLAGLGGVFVAGLMDFSEEDRLEIPFLLHKLRIFHISIRSWLQAFVLTGSLGSLSHLRESVRSSLFSRIHRDKVCRLRRRWKPEARVVLPVASGDGLLASAICEVAASCRSGWGRVVVVQSGIPPEEAAALRNRIVSGLEDRDDEPLMVDVVGSLDEFTPERTGERSPWLLLIEDGRPESMQLAAELNLPRLAEGVFWISLPLEHLGAERIPATRRVRIPVLGGDKTQGLWIRHAAGLLELLEVTAPIERSDWGQFGLPRVGEIPTVTELFAEHAVLDVESAGDGGERAASPAIEVAVGFELECDPPDRARLASASHPRTSAGGDSHTGILEWVARPRNRQSTRGIVLDPEREHRVAMQSANRIVAVGVPRIEGRIGIWHADAVDIPFRRRFDLARETFFLRRHDGRFFSPTSVGLDAEGRVRIRAEAQPREHLRQAMQFSIWRADLDLTIRSGVEHWQESESTLRGDQVAFLECRAIDRDRLTARRVGLRLCGLCSEEGGLLRSSLDRFVYDAGVSALCLGMGSAERLESEGLDGGSWSTQDGEEGTADAQRRFDPLFSAALHRSLERRAPGIGRLGRVLAFHPDSGGTVLLLLEPWDCMGAFWKTFKLMLKEDPIRRALVQETLALMKKIVEETREDESSSMATARRCGLGFDGAGVVDVAAAVKALQLIERG